MKAIITDISQLDLNKSYTVGDYLSWQFDEMVELIKGKLYKMSPAPRSKHQAIVHNIDGLLFTLTRRKKCKVYPAPFDVYLKGLESDKDTVVQPDICIICDPAKIHDRGCVGAPDMIVEIVSPSTLKKDIDYKYHLYEENGVKEYWIVSPEYKQVSVYLLNQNNEYELRENYLEESHEEIPIFTLNDVTIKTEDVFYF